MWHLGLVSIIMPVYNAAEYIKQSLDSIVDQSYKNYELIIIDDASEDNSLVIINEFIKEQPQIKVKIINNNYNQGQSKGYNEGLKHSSGKYVCYLAADDTYKSDFIMLMVSKIDCGFDLVYCGYDEIDVKTNTTTFYQEKRKFLDNSTDIINGYLFGTTHFSHASAMYRKDFLIKNRIFYNENCRLGEDIEFVSNLLLKRPLCSSVPYSLYEYRRRVKSVTNTLNTSKINSCLSALNRIQENVPTIRKKILFVVTRKASIVFHLINDLYSQQVVYSKSFTSCFSCSLLFLIHVLRKPHTRFNKKYFNAFFYFIECRIDAK